MSQSSGSMFGGFGINDSRLSSFVFELMCAFSKQGSSIAMHTGQCLSAFRVITSSKWLQRPFPFAGVLGRCAGQTVSACIYIYTHTHTIT